MAMYLKCSKKVYLVNTHGKNKPDKKNQTKKTGNDYQLNDYQMRPNHEEDKSPVCSCPRNLDFTCGWDGKTYDNPCKANCAAADNVQCRGQCPCKDCRCARLLWLTCGRDGITYD